MKITIYADMPFTSILGSCKLSLSLKINIDLLCILIEIKQCTSVASSYFFFHETPDKFWCITFYFGQILISEKKIR